MRVLLVEDTDDLRYLFARVLRCHGFIVREAANGVEALRTVSDFLPELIITDLAMPVMDGFELIRRLKALPETGNRPIVAITANAGVDVEFKAREAGAVDFLVKPVDIPSLVDRLYGIGSSDRLLGL